MGELNKYKHLLIDGEYAKRERIISGLTLNQVTTVPAPKLHTIYDELWHTTKWQNIVLSENDKEKQDLLSESWNKGEVYPEYQPKSKEEWDLLVKEFINGLNRALEMSNDHEALNKKDKNGLTFGDGLGILAMHTAYHLGKIVALRQMMGVWPPENTKN